MTSQLVLQRHLFVRTGSAFESGGSWDFPSRGDALQKANGIRTTCDSFDMGRPRDQTGVNAGSPGVLRNTENRAIFGEDLRVVRPLARYRMVGFEATRLIRNNAFGEGNPLRPFEPTFPNGPKREWSDREVISHSQLGMFLLIMAWLVCNWSLRDLLMCPLNQVWFRVKGVTTNGVSSTSVGRPKSIAGRVLGRILS